MPALRKTSIKAEEEIAMLNANTVEMRRTFDHISNIYDQLRVKALAFIAGEVAIVTFLFATEVKYPNVLYGQILYLAAIGAMALAFGLLLWTVSAVPWKIPCDFNFHKTTKENHINELGITRYIHDEYVKVLEYCLPLVSKRARRFNYTIYLLSGGVIMVLLIKYGGIAS